MRLSVSCAIISESGYKLDKLKQSHKIYVIVALSMACLAAVRSQKNSGGMRSYTLTPPYLMLGQKFTKHEIRPDGSLTELDRDGKPVQRTSIRVVRGHESEHRAIRGSLTLTRGGCS